MSLSVSKYVSLMQRENLLLLISLVDPNLDFSQHSDEELIELLYEIYPQDVLNSLKLTKNSFKEDMAILTDYVSCYKNLSSFIFAIQTSNTSVNLFWNINNSSLDNYYISCAEIKNDEIKEFYELVVEENKNSITVIIPYEIKNIQFFLYNKKDDKKNIILKTEIINLSFPYYKENTNYMDELFFMPFINKDLNFAVNNIELKEEYEKQKSC